MYCKSPKGFAKYTAKYSEDAGETRKERTFN